HVFFVAAAKTWMAGTSPAMTTIKSRAQTSSLLVAEVRLDGAMHLDRQRVAVTVLGISRGDAHPALPDAILLDLGFLDALEANADIAREDLGIVVRAVRIDRKTVGKLVAHRFVVLTHSSASISFLNPSGVAVGA